MGTYEEDLIVEKRYLEQVIAVVKDKLQGEQESIERKKKNLIAARRHMYESTSHYAYTFSQLLDMVQQSVPLQVLTYDYEATAARIRKYKKMLDSPYFARIDFKEKGRDLESIYIGTGNLTDDKTYRTYVYDWRAPVASIFYRYEPGEAGYRAPGGTVKGELTLKRQYEIKKGKLLYFFDSNVSVLDDMLKMALSRNASPKMRTIVETIQREQDVIIRDLENELVIVQGVAGSGKTAVALHRVAFLMYRGLSEKLNANNIVLISPNFLFGRYIANVLPELGEENIQALTFEDIFALIFKNSIRAESRNMLFEEMITAENERQRELLKAGVDFKLSKTFLVILERFMQYYERRMIEFSDIYYNGEYIVDRHRLKMKLLDRQKKAVPLEKRLQLIKTQIKNMLQEKRRARYRKLEKFVAEHTEARPEDAKALARLLAIKQGAALRKAIDKFIRIDYLSLYRALFADKALFFRLAKGLVLPPGIELIMAETVKNLAKNRLRYDDAIALMYLKIRMAGYSAFSAIRQVVVDEAQDYYPLHYELLKLLFPRAKFTVLGDINQTIEKQADLSFYNEIKVILNKRKTTTFFLTRSYRSSYEINAFSAKLLDNGTAMESFERHGSAPEVIGKASTAELDEAVLADIIGYEKSGYASIAVICKSMRQAEELYGRIKSRIDVKLIREGTPETVAGVHIMPVYMAKGLEFDAVLVYEANDANYRNAEDKKLLYVACTRALHRLSLYYTGRISKFLL